MEKEKECILSEVFSTIPRSTTYRINSVLWEHDLVQLVSYTHYYRTVNPVALEE